MQVSKLFTLVLLPFALALPATRVVERADNANAVVSAIGTISSQLVTLNTSVTNFKAGLLDLGQALDVQLQSSVLASDLQKAVTDAVTSSNFTSDESVTVGLALVNLEPQIFSVLDNIESKKTAFDEVVDVFSLSATVKSDLQQEASLSAQLGAAVQAKLVPSVASLAPPINSAIASAFAAAISVYSQPGGLIPLPPIPRAT